MKRTFFDEETRTRFTFDDDKWIAIADVGTGRLGHWTQQGDRQIFKSPRPRADGKYRYVLAGLGFWTSDTGGSDWGTDAEYIDTFCRQDAPLETDDPKDDFGRPLGRRLR